MAESLAKHLGEQPLIAVLRALFLSVKPLHIRGLAAQTSLSPAGVWDIIRRLREWGVLVESARGNRRFFLLVPSARSTPGLAELFAASEQAFLRERAKILSRGAAKRFAWMEEALSYSRVLKRAGQ